MNKYLCILAVLVCCKQQAKSQNFDVNLLRKINANGQFSGYWTTTTNSIYKVGMALPLGIAIAGELSGNRSLTYKGLRIGETIIVNCLVTELLKRAATRERPSARWKGMINAYRPGNDGKSLPSGHTSFAFSTATSTALEFKKWYITVPAFAYAASVGYSRMYLGAHYPSDVFAGAVVGTGTALVMHWVNHKVFNKKKPEVKAEP